jgi:hypothetical protein
MFGRPLFKSHTASGEELREPGGKMIDQCAHAMATNVHNEGRAPILRASLSIVLLAVLTRLA